MTTHSKLLELLNYDRTTGIFTWAKTRGGAHKGKIAGEKHKSSRSQTTYIRIEINGIRYFAHELAWFYVTGKLPDGPLDHIDRDGENNIFENLRLCTQSQNKFNSPVYKNNTSGYSGITLYNGKWKTEIRCQKKYYYLGLFENLETAVKVRAQKAKELFGEFA